MHGACLMHCCDGHCSPSNSVPTNNKPNLTGVWDKWNGWTDYLPVTVTVDGKVSECKGEHCRFSFHSGWYHTPRIYSVTPQVISLHSCPHMYTGPNASSQPTPLRSILYPGGRRGHNRRSEREIPQPSIRIRRDASSAHGDPFGEVCMS